MGIHDADYRAMQDLSEEDKVKRMALATCKALIAAMDALPPQQMVDVPQLLEALCADYTDPRTRKVKANVLAELTENAGQLMRRDCNPWTAEQAVSRAKGCEWRFRS